MLNQVKPIEISFHVNLLILRAHLRTSQQLRWSPTTVQRCLNTVRFYEREYVHVQCAPYNRVGARRVRMSQTFKRNSSDFFTIYPHYAQLVHMFSKQLVGDRLGMRLKREGCFGCKNPISRSSKNLFWYENMHSTSVYRHELYGSWPPPHKFGISCQ